MRWPFQTTSRAVLEMIANRGLHILGIIIFAMVVRAIVRRAVVGSFGHAAETSEDSARAARLRTLGGLVSSTAGYAIFFIALMMVLTEFGVDTKAVLTAAGVFGIAIGLGAQKLVRDVIGGFFILLENQFSVGETVTLGGPAVTGAVEEMGLRVTRLRDDVGRLVIVGNADITSVTNHSRGSLTVTVDIVLPAGADVSARQAAMVQALAGLKEGVWAEGPRVLGLVEPPVGMVKIRVTGRAVPGQQEIAERELRAALHLVTQTA